MPELLVKTKEEETPTLWDKIEEEVILDLKAEEEVTLDLKDGEWWKNERPNEGFSELMTHYGE